MFYSQFILAKKGPLGTIWIAAHLERKLRKNQVTETNISVSVDSILFPEVPIALRLSGHLLLGVVRIYSRKVNYLFHDCSEALVKIKQAFHAGAVDLPPEAATAPFHSITLPETFDLDEFEPLPDREMHLLHSNGAVDHHVTTREQITLQDPLEDNSYMESQFGLDERFPEGDVPRMGIDFDEDLLEKPSREATPAAITLEEDEVLPANMGDGMDYDQMDRMEAMDMDDHHEPGTPALGMDNMDMDYHTEVDGMGDGDLNRSPGVLEDSDNEHHEHHAEEIEMDNFEPDLNKPDQLEPATPGSLEHEEQELKGDLLGEVDKIENVEEEGGMIMDKDVQNLDDEEEQAPVTLLAEKDEPAKQEEEEEEEIPREDEVKLPELEGEGEKLEVEGASEGPIEENSKEEEANKQEVPEYETVMSAVEIPNQEPDVFDLDQDMEKEMPRTDYKDQDVFMEDGDAVLIEEGDDRMQFEDPQIAVDEPASPMNSPSMPMFNPDALPGDDDVLASLLGRGTPALKLIPTPTETAVGKPRRKQGQRKRKIVMDMNTILPADVMREQLMNTDDIRRVRKKAPCTRQELWIVQKDALGQQIFYEHSVPGLCGDLRVLFQRVYVAGHADLPLAEDDLPLSDDVQAELFATEEVPDLHPVPSVEDVVKEMNEGPVATAGPVIEDQAIHFFDDQGLQTDVASPVKIVDEHLQGDSVARRVDDLDEAESQLHADQLGGPFADVVDPLVVEEVNEPPAASHAPEEENKEEDLTDLPVSESKAVETSPRSPTIEEPLAVEEQEPAREETEEIALPLKEADVDISAVTAEVGPEPGFQVVEAEHIAEIMNEDMTEVSEVLPEVLPEAQPKTLSPTIRQEPMVEEQGEDEEERVASAGHDLEVHSPSREVEDQIAEEEPNEELGFLADTRDTVFLAADDDDLCEEAEDFQDANDYGQKETLAQDNSGWSARTRAVGHYLRTTLESKDAHMKKREEEGIAKLGLEQILVGKTRKEAARMFFETLVLKTKDYIHVEQDSPYCDIQISARPKLLKANF